MTEFRAHVAQLIRAIDPSDALEASHQSQALAWIESGAPLCRTERPAVPREHLVAYAVAMDPIRQEVLLVDHRLAGRWLPTGGHVEPGEHPAETARRELREELDATGPHLARTEAPVMITRTVTVGRTAGHIDVSLWFAFEIDADTDLNPDPVEFADVRWWPYAEIVHGTGTEFDPHLPRFVAKAQSLQPSEDRLPNRP